MTGRKQHHIPQVLLRGFGCKEGGRSTLVWVYSATRGKYRSATEGVGSQRDFYSPPATSDQAETLDDRITQYEQQHVGPRVAAFRALEPGMNVDAREAAETVAHLSIRVSHVREAFSSGVIDLFTTVEGTFQDPRLLVKLLKVHENPPGRIVRDLIRDAWTKDRVTWMKKGITKEGFCRTLLAGLRANGNTLLADAEPLVSALFMIMRQRAAAMTREAHKRALNQGLAPEPRVETLAALTWTVQAGPPLGCILPDCVATALTDDGDCLPLAFTDGDRIGTVAMPLCHDRILVGVRRGTAAFVASEAMLAAASWDFFVAREDHSAKDAIIPHIGQRIRSYLEELVRESIIEARR